MIQDPRKPFQTAIALREVTEELARAQRAFPEFHSAHEGYAVLLEEVEELKAHVFTNQKKRDDTAMRQEAIQVAAMAIRFLTDLCEASPPDRVQEVKA